MIYYTEYLSPIGKIVMAGNEEGLAGLWFAGQKYFMAGMPKADCLQNVDLKIFLLTKNWLDRYFAGEKPSISEIPVNPNGSAFRKQVWDILRQIPYGETVTYKEIASKIAKSLNKYSMSAQAVGGAVGHNPISIIIPCHRVMGSNGSLTGYAGGLEKKIALLTLEGAKI